ncbi:MAG: DMT family transporter [Chloroflexota bacterium]|nr:DMT family transporter [Chloroflexota bacterium]
MLETISTFIIGLIGGISVGIQSPITGLMSQRIGSAAGSLIVHVSGAIFSLILVIVRGGETIGEWRALPLYMLGSGAFGLLLVLTISHTIPRLGAGAGIVLIIVGQLVTGMVIDHFGWFGTPMRPVDLTRLIAAAMLLGGGYLMVR